MKVKLHYDHTHEKKRSGTTMDSLVLSKTTAQPLQELRRVAPG